MDNILPERTSRCIQPNGEVAKSGLRPMAATHLSGVQIPPSPPCIMGGIMKINCCLSKHLLSECGAENPKDCAFFQKATYHNRCTFQTIELSHGEYNCACMEARADKQKDEASIIEQLILEEEEGHIDT
jgi:hypothetical protein